MVFLFNKAKIYSYLVAVTTVIVLFAVAANIDEKDLSIQASTTNTENKVENKIDNKMQNTINSIIE